MEANLRLEITLEQMEILTWASAKEGLHETFALTSYPLRGGHQAHPLAGMTRLPEAALHVELQIRKLEAMGMLKRRKGRLHATRAGSRFLMDSIQMMAFGVG
ncbi:MAG: hypothetical protein AB1443_09860 [Pseudomonadota bacterium]